MLVLKNIGQVITLRGGANPRRGSAMEDLGAIDNGAIVVRGERIAWVGRTRDLPVPEPGADHEVIDGVGLALVALPGFVDSHTHSVFAVPRASEYDMRTRGWTYAEIARDGGGILSSVRHVRSATQEELVGRGEVYLRKFLNHGTTTLEIKSGYGLTPDDEIKMLQVVAALRSRSRLDLVATFLGAHAIPEEFREARGEYVRLVVEQMIPRVARAKLASFCDVFCETGYFSVEEARVILLAGRAAGMGLRIHADELTRSGGALLAAELRADSADHLEWIEQPEIDALRASGTIAVLLPGTAFTLGLERYAPARRLIAAGVPVALATDFNPGTCFTPNMQIILSIACNQMKMTPAETITAATLNAACSLGLSPKLGSLEEGKQADIVLMNVADYREIPYFFGVNHCVLVVKKGHVALNHLEAA